MPTVNVALCTQTSTNHNHVTFDSCTLVYMSMIYNNVINYMLFCLQRNSSVVNKKDI